MTDKILLVEDDPGLVMALADLLSAEGYSAETASDGLEGLERASVDGRFDLIILDVMLPGKSGFDVCRDLRQRGVNTPILMLTARGQVIDKVLGLKLGADDYLTKPFEPLELLARIEAILRRRQTVTSSADSPEAAYSFGSVRVDFRSTEVRRGDKRVELSAREFQLLRYFIEQRGATLSRRQLLHEVWGYETAILTRTVDVHVGLLRQKLEEDVKNPRHFLTVRGHGYKFVD
ncbi:MAG TPA: response regulator transcription factor [Pyrinomonadaceae bacterium]|jgi:two-component system alkaline phosphatase synthesis response regulator PhoP